ncbi:MAG: 3-oxo-5-alpha-steroid 4-dehydrogenase [Nannocystaceae bacterium]
MTWYTGDPTYDFVLAAALIFAAFVALVAPFIPSPYGRFASDRFGVALDPRIGWFLMELPATLSFLFFFFTGPRWSEVVPLCFLGVWLVHYGNRGFFFPFSIRAPRGAKASFSLMVIAVGWVVTSLHGYLHGSFFSEHGHYTIEWLRDPRFLIGLPIYGVSLALNIHSDAIVRNLRSRDEVAMGEKVYRIPRGGLFRWVTSPAYLTELTAWAGLALATWSLASVFIFAISAANLVPRAVSTHRWYRDRFPDYPRERRALIPFLF